MTTIILDTNPGNYEQPQVIAAKLIQMLHELRIIDRALYDMISAVPDQQHVELHLAEAYQANDRAIVALEDAYSHIHKVRPRHA